MRSRNLFFALVVPLALLAAALADSRVAHAPDAPAPVGITAVFGGDIMLDRNVAAWNEGAPAQIFEGVREIFSGADITAANLEGTITKNASIARHDSRILRFTFDPQFAREALGPLSLDAASLANNHALDFYKVGYDETREHLALLGIVPFGHPNNALGSLSAKVEAKGRTFCFVGYHELYDDDTAHVLQEIRNLRGLCWKIIVFAHWGEEYEKEPSAAQRREAHVFIDAGADLVIGAHPHVIQPYEVYGSRAIFYSLGNFAFDQEFSPEVKRGMLVRAAFYEDKTAFSVIPIVIERGRVSALPEVDTFELP
ncbi:hypothetical protein A2852_01740 [Candidatus Adlerbacteria bacterium RIFCSPHIGHO2_01_FULL_54_23]|uniref:Capsule synthesis protein CapA domain-containing protein n=3 Tax=Candidatus Adleribacteriota TaxID=1752736 RepID=A0A1F4Y176_9BACT|nr:MAG: Capsule synthesis protein CapA [Candidatus Adlerbacteria bacterium GW2011_GWA1_54_10]KKW38046.1 MAG: Capsule synthesis protein CapA [Candidatus Adlerbacteria bacterium GW2011_GWB1_54_7]OGC79463.1 MAG: hypothetical protein A2852_01740 [Candidatus Adlerbacteria bacterium RIFCSPHIGHO2_01_FULL_54_23]OGC87073.1 MAG: hypothetical protein A3B33_00405 [Candidatus Adlerbacteria bacterium RIFCSPLOWO2_01_FULL_54_16]